MTKFRKRPVVVEAWRNVEGAIPPDWLQGRGTGASGEVIHFVDVNDGSISIDTLEGVMRAAPGDWIIRGVKGEVYPCKPDVFAATYEPVDGCDDATSVGETARQAIFGLAASLAVDEDFADVVRDVVWALSLVGVSIRATSREELVRALAKLNFLTLAGTRVDVEAVARRSE